MGSEMCIRDREYDRDIAKFYCKGYAVGESTPESMAFRITVIKSRYKSFDNK